jgi:hypothetical protein
MRRPQSFCASSLPFSSAVFELLETRRLLAGDWRSYDGTGNNLAHPQWGSTDEQLLRLVAAAYADGLSAPAGATRPSARLISNAIVAHPEDEMPIATRLSAYGYLWGQFIDHDLDLTPGASPAEPFNITVPTGDPYFDPDSTGTQVIPLNRSRYDSATGQTSPRQQLNSITSYLDGSMIYGSDAARAMALRTGIGGLLKTSAGNMLPFNTMGLANDTSGLGPPEAFFVAGDVRANENVELTAIHTLFLREHNRIARKIAASNPTLSDEEVYQRARRIVVGEIQSITYNEYLPALLGPTAMGSYRGYNSSVNTDVANEFSTAAFRLGHSMLADDVEFMDNNGHDVHDEIPLAEAFFNPALVSETGIDPLLKYLASSNSEEIDNKIVDGLRNFLFGPPGAGGFDLASLNIQRGRDHGLADYNTARAALGLPRVTSFAQISYDPGVQQALQATYGSVDDIDLWVGGLAENHVQGSNLGPTFQRIVVNEFRRARDGDRYWYERYLSPSEEYAVEHTTLADIIRRNSALTNLQDNVFVFNVQASGRVWNDRDRDGRFDLLERGIPGRRVELLDDTGAVIDFTVTGANGTYRFTGIQIGDYTVRANLPTGWQTTTPGTQALAVTRGQRFDNLNFGQRRLLMMTSIGNGLAGGFDTTDRTESDVATAVLDV